MRLALSWLALFWLWLLLVGQWSLEQWIAAAVAATVAAALGEVGSRRAGVELRLPPRRLVQALEVPLAVVVDFAIVMGALLRRRRGEFIRRPMPDGASDPSTAAWLELVSTYSPNAYVVDIDADHGVSVVHDLVRRRRSERPL